VKSVPITLSDSINTSSVPPPVKPPVDGRLVKLAPLIAGNVPVKLAAGIDVKLAALAVGKVAGNLASGIVPDVKFVALNWVRSTGKLLNARVNLIENNLAEVSLNDYEDGISPGQACVFYDLDKIGHKVLGGGWIVS